MNTNKRKTLSGALKIALTLGFIISIAAAPARTESGFSVADNKRGQNVTMTFQDADIAQIINFMQDITGRTIIADGEVRGSITIACDTNLPVEEAMSVLNSALKAKGFTMVQSGNIIRIVKMEESKQTNVPTRIGSEFSDLPESEQIITQVVPLTHTDGAKVRADLKALIGKDGELLNNEASNSLIITDTAANVKRIMKIVNFLDRESPRQTQIKVYTLDYAKAKDLAALIAQLPKSSSGAATPEQQPGSPAVTTYPAGESKQLAAKAASNALQISGELTVLADERSNSLIVATAPQNFDSIEKLIKSLDRMLSQVLIEVIIMEASLDTNTKMGMEWAALKERTVDGAPVTGNFASNWNIAAEEIGFKATILKNGGADQLLAFLMRQDEKINILSTPMVMTSDNQEASILVGSEVPYLKETRRSVGDTRDYVYEYKNVGISLKVTPHINEQKYVVMDIHQEIKKLGPQTLFDAYIIITREADANVVAKDGQTIVLGGLMRDDKTTTNNSIPLLSDIPLVGKLFNYKRSVGEKTELLVFITPYVVTSEAEVEQITNKQKMRMKSLGLKESDKEIALPDSK